MQVIKESYSQKPTLLSKDIQNKISLLKGNVTQFALENIKLELLSLKDARNETGDVSHVTVDQPCSCKWRKNYRLPCRHLLQEFQAEPIPLHAIHQRWRIGYTDGKGMP